MESSDFFIVSVLILVTLIVTVTVSISLSNFTVVDGIDSSALTIAKMGMWVGWLAVISVFVVVAGSYSNNTMTRRIGAGFSLMFLILSGILYAVAQSKGEAGESAAENLSTLKALNAAGYIALVIGFLAVGYVVGIYHKGAGILDKF